MGQVEPVPQKSTREQIRDQKRAVDRSKRAIEREKNRLEREKKKMLTEIKKMAMKGQHVCNTHTLYIYHILISFREQQNNLHGQLHKQQLR